MIASLRGTVLAVAPGTAVVDVGGVGLAVQCSPTTLAGLRVGAEATLSTSLVVRETELTLYGFADGDAKEVFETLQTSTGVGPKLAQAVLAVHEPDGVRRAVAEEDLAALCLVPGIGKKGAQRLVLELKDRLGAPTRPGPAAAPSASAAPTGQLHAALLSLGYSAREADEGVAAVAGSAAVAVPSLLREALAVLRR